ncbi:hypothetical protein NSMS1_08750 [Nostoc sp. MS1]|nr:hypothetical protein NSMS1_08750 [Nostoc sp. MS1]
MIKTPVTYYLLSSCSLILLINIEPLNKSSPLVVNIYQDIIFPVTDVDVTYILRS